MGMGRYVGYTCRPPSLTLRKRGVGMRRRACTPSSTPCHHRRRTLRRITMHPSLSPCPPPSPVINELRGMTTSVIIVPLPLLPCLYPLPLPPFRPTLALLPFCWFYRRWCSTGGRGHRRRCWPVMTWQSGCWWWHGKVGGGCRQVTWRWFGWCWGSRGAVMWRWWQSRWGSGRGSDGGGL